MNSRILNIRQTSSQTISIPIATSQGMSLISCRREINLVARAEFFRAGRARGP